MKSRWRSHEFGEKPPPLVVDSRIQAISLLFFQKKFNNNINACMIKIYFEKKLDNYSSIFYKKRAEINMKI
jgi:hypothetical protein